MPGLRSLLIVCVSLAAACGGDPVRHTPDAPPGSPDAYVDAVASHLVSIAVTLGGVGAPGITVHFQNADSTVVSSTVTDAQGTASAMMADGGYVTASEPIAPNELYTWAGVKGGDHLQLDRPERPPSMFTLTFNADSNDVSVSYYIFHSNCSRAIRVIPSGSTISLSSCGPTIDVLVEAVDGAGNTLSAFFHPDVPVTDGATVALTDTLTLVTNTTLNFTNVADVMGGSLYVRGQLASPKGVVHAFPPKSLTQTAGAATATVPLPTFTGALQIIETDTMVTQNGDQHVIDWKPQAATYNLDVEAALLQSYDSFPQFDPTTHSFTWTLTGTTTQGDFVIGSANILRELAGRSWYWTIAAPATGTTLALPVIPAGTFDFNPAATDIGSLNQLITAKIPGGYDAARARVLSVDSPADFTAGTSGTIVYERVN
ncbi:MAG: hypothetical protein JWO36_7258 [Myxococcales bacterium]|nr:hypothetical protein [Myxococcales bacterium]